MRQIKFKGLRTDGKGWVYGQLVKCEYENRSFILEFEGIESGCTIFKNVEAIPESIGQFTGLHDKNGVEIYEGDMMKTEDSTYAYVVWEDAAFAMKSQGSEAVDWVHSSEYSKSEIIGSIHTNQKGQEG